MLVIKYLHWPSLGETLDRFSSVDKFKFKQNLCTIKIFHIQTISLHWKVFPNFIIINMTLEVYKHRFLAIKHTYIM